MRDLDSKGIMSGDFIVVYGDVVSNLPLAEALATHRARRAKDKNAIMTMVLREAGIEHRTKARGTSPVFVVDPTKDRCLHYEQISRKQPGKFVQLEPELLTGLQEIELRHDLIDCGIDICTPDVLALWSDNFDYEAPRRNFLHSVLKDYELNGKTVHTYIVKDHYAARVRNLHAFDSVSKDIISRWAYPMCPDSNLLEGQTYRFRKNTYQERDVDLAWGCTIGARTVLGRGTKVGKGSKIKNSVIGRNCRIGEKCVIENSYLWDGATVGDESYVKQSILANNVIVGKGCEIREGALLSYAVRIADGVVVQKRQRITVQDRKQSPASPAVKVVGTDGVGHDYVPSHSEDDDTKGGLGGSSKSNQVVEDAYILNTISVYKTPGFSISAESISTLDSEESSIEELVNERDRSASFLSATSEDGGAEATDGFHQDAVSSIYDALKEGTEVSTIQLELQSLRMTANATEHQVRRAVVTALIKYLAEARTTGVTTVKHVLGNNTMLFERIMFDKERDLKDDQVDFLLLVQKDLAGRKDGDGSEGIMLQFCNELYMLDVLEQEALEQWFDDDRSMAGEGMDVVRKQVEKFMEVLVALESESESVSESASESVEEEGDEDEESEDD